MSEKLPEGWTDTTIGSICEIITGKKDTQNKLDNGQYPFFVRSQTVERIDSFAYDGEAILTAGDGVGTGKVFHYINGKFDYHQRVYRLSRFIESINGKFLFYYFSSNFLKEVQKLSAKGSVDSVRMEMISGMKIPNPPLAEQKKIAEILTSVDDVIENTQAQIDKLQDLKKATMNELLTRGIGHTEFKDSALGRIPKSWEVVLIRKIGKCQGGFAFSSNDAQEKGVKWLKIANVGIGELKWDERSYLPVDFEHRFSEYKLKENDLVFAMTRPVIRNQFKIAKIPLSQGSMLLNQRVARMIPNSSITNCFLFTTLSSEQFCRKLQIAIAGSDPPNVSSIQIESIKIVLPPIEEQLEISKIINAIQERITHSKLNLDKIKSLKKALMNDLLTGKVRVN